MDDSIWLHRSPNKFTSFDKSKINSSNGENLVNGFWFRKNDTTKQDGEHISFHRLNLENPLHVYPSIDKPNVFEKTLESVVGHKPTFDNSIETTKKMIDAGHDGVIIHQKDSSGVDGSEAIAFHAHKIERINNNLIEKKEITMKTIEDLVSNAIEQKPKEFQDTFNDIILDKIRDAVEKKKENFARIMFNYNPEEETPEEPINSEEENV